MGPGGTVNSVVEVRGGGDRIKVERTMQAACHRLCLIGREGGE